MSDKPKVGFTINEALNGIELTFSEKPSEDILALLKKERLYRWHPRKKLWYAGNSAKARDAAIEIISKTEGRNKADIEKEFTINAVETQTSISKKQENNIPNTFAAYYETVTESIPIKKTGTEVGLRDRRATYIEDLNLYYHVYNGAYDSQITLIDLEHAQKRGKVCPRYSINLPASSQRDLIGLLYERGIQTVSDLWKAIKGQDERLHDIVIDTYESRSIDIFSPFVEVKPLKHMPEKWTRANLVQALLSGQIYKGEVSYRYTDDYAYDAAYGFGTGCRLNLAKTAQDIIEGWYSTSSISGSQMDHDKNKAILHYSVHSNSSDTLYFDLTFDHKKGQEYRRNEEEAIERFNQSLKNSVIHPDYHLIDPGKVYEIQLIDTHTNSGIYETKIEPIQGYFLKEYLKEQDNYYLENLIGFHEMPIKDDHYYAVDIGYQEWPQIDSRMIQADPHTTLVTGKALLELCAEGKYLDKIQENYTIGKTYEDIKAHIQSFQSGKSFFMFSDKSIDYEASLTCLEQETMRAKGERGKNLNALLEDAEYKKNESVAKGKVIAFPQRV